MPFRMTMKEFCAFGDLKIEKVSVMIDSFISMIDGDEF